MSACVRVCFLLSFLLPMTKFKGVHLSIRENPNVGGIETSTKKTQIAY